MPRIISVDYSVLSDGLAEQIRAQLAAGVEDCQILDVIDPDKSLPPEVRRAAAFYAVDQAAIVGYQET
jgi:hypothetical protein